MNLIIIDFIIIFDDLAVGVEDGGKRRVMKVVGGGMLDNDPWGSQRSPSSISISLVDSIKLI